MTNKLLQLYELAYHQFHEVYPAVHNPRLFIGILKTLQRVHEELGSLSDEDQKRLESIKNMIRAYNSSTTSFPRDDQVVICDDEFGVQAITKVNIEVLLHKTKQMIEKVM